MEITKTDYLLYKQCPKSLWLKKNQPKVMEESQQDEAADLELVRELALQLFPSGISLRSKDIKDTVEKTKEYITAGYPLLYNAAFQFGNAFVVCEVLEKGETGWNLYKITSSTGVNERQLDDIAFQTYITNKNIPVESVSVIHINKEYIRESELNIRELFVIDGVAEEVEKLKEGISADIEEMESLIEKGVCNKEIGSHCDKYGKDSLTCPAKGHCWSHIPSYSVFNITRIGKKAMDLYQKGIVKIEDIPKDYKLSETQKFQVESHKTKKNVVDVAKIKEFLRTFTFPLYFLDFETYQQAIPLYEGIKPYQQIPFQYSLHILKDINENLTHKEFLAEEGKDSRRILAEKLMQDIPKNVSVIAYNMSFEKMVIKALAEQFQDLADHLMNIHDNIVDLMIPFQQKWYYTNDMKGSYSIKYVLPALFPNEKSLNYKSLNIQNGSMAMDTYAKLQTYSQEEREKIRQDLLKYCELDTYAMVKIWEFLYFL